MTAVVIVLSVIAYLLVGGVVAGLLQRFWPTHSTAPNKDLDMGFAALFWPIFAVGLAVAGVVRLPLWVARIVAGEERDR